MLKLFRDIGVNNDQLSLEELSLTIRNLFGTPLAVFDKDQFLNLLVHCSYLVFTKNAQAGNLSIAECFEKILQMLKIPTREKDRDIKDNKKILLALREAIQNSEIESAKKEEQIENIENDIDDHENPENPLEIAEGDKSQVKKKDILLPPGFKKINTTVVNFEYKLPSSFFKFLPESKVIGIELLNEIISKVTGSNIIEPIVKVNRTIDVTYDTSDPNYKRWSPSIALTYAKMDKSFQKEAKEVGDLLEDILKAVEKGKTSIEKLKVTPPLERMEQESYSKFLEEEKSKDKARKLRKQMVKKKLDEMKQKKDEEEKKREEDLKKLKQDKEDKLKKQLLMDREIRKQMKEKIKVSQKQKEEEKSNKEKAEKEKKDEIVKKKEQEKTSFFRKQHRKLKVQFTTIKNVKEEFVKKQNEMMKAVYKLPDVNIKKLLEKDKSYVEFERNLNDTLDEMIKKAPISDVFAKYENHIKVIYDIYYKIGSKISRNTDEFMFLNEFKEFCLNFTVLGLLINNEQMTYIFRKVCKRNEWSKEEKLYFNYSDFVLSLLLISICSKFTHRARKVLPSDLEGTDANTVQAFFDFLGLKLPFNKREVEEFINDRRALSAKQLSKLQQKIKKEKIDLMKNDDVGGDEAKKPKRMLNNNFVKKNQNKEETKKDNKEKKIEDVNMSKLEDVNTDKTKIFNPSGKPENWQVKK
jgi:hypothetical protein